MGVREVKCPRTLQSEPYFLMSGFLTFALLLLVFDLLLPKKECVRDARANHVDHERWVRLTIEVAEEGTIARFEAG